MGLWIRFCEKGNIIIMFKEYPKDQSSTNADALQKLIDQVTKFCPSATEGLAYGLPSFKYGSESLVGFSATKDSLSFYTYDPRLIELVRQDLPDFDVGKGVIRFAPDQPLPESVVELLVGLRMQAVDKKH